MISGSRMIQVKRSDEGDPDSNMSVERAQALNRLRALKSDPGNHIFWIDLAFKAREIFRSSRRASTIYGSNPKAI